VAQLGFLLSLAAAYTVLLLALPGLPLAWRDGAQVPSFCFFLLLFHLFLFLFVFLLLILLPFPFPSSCPVPPTSQIPCILAATLLQYTFLCAALFLLLEALIVLHKLVDAVMLPILESGLFVLAVGLLLPAAYTAITHPLLYSYILPATDTTCWLNLASPASAATLVPLPLLLIVALYVLITAIVGANGSGRRPLSSEIYSRAK
jgi:hypothetical protein